MFNLIWQWNYCGVRLSWRRRVLNAPVCVLSFLENRSTQICNNWSVLHCSILNVVMYWHLSCICPRLGKYMCLRRTWSWSRGSWVLSMSRSCRHLMELLAPKLKGRLLDKKMQLPLDVYCVDVCDLESYFYIISSLITTRVEACRLFFPNAYLVLQFWTEMLTEHAYMLLCQSSGPLPLCSFSISSALEMITC
jgi:hypothetical protein